VNAGSRAFPEMRVMPFFLLAILVVLLALVVIITVAYFLARRW
jgi:hypothetical protein